MLKEGGGHNATHNVLNDEAISNPQVGRGLSNKIDCLQRALNHEIREILKKYKLY